MKIQNESANDIVKDFIKVISILLFIANFFSFWANSFKKMSDWETVGDVYAVLALNVIIILTSVSGLIAKFWGLKNTFYIKESDIKPEEMNTPINTTDIK